MDDLISREALRDALSHLKGSGRVYLWEPEKILEIIEKAPSGVVRCVECRYYGENHYGDKVCEHPMQDGDWLDAAWLDTTPDDFCSYGERKEN